MTNRAKDSRRKFTVALLACLAVSLVCVAYPMYVIRPFRAQGARELAVALVVTRFRPVDHRHRRDRGDRWRWSDTGACSR